MRERERERPRDRERETEGEIERATHREVREAGEGGEDSRVKFG